MRSLVRTYYLPAETAERLERLVPRGKRSALISRLMDEWLDEQLDEQARERLRADITESSREMADDS